LSAPRWKITRHGSYCYRRNAECNQVELHIGGSFNCRDWLAYSGPDGTQAIKKDGDFQLMQEEK
jgi:hypothetical protein